MKGTRFAAFAAVAFCASLLSGTARSVLAQEAVAPGPVPEITPDFDHLKHDQDPKHTPKITAPDKVKAGEWFDVTVEIGNEARHPSLVEHHVRWIGIYKDDVEIARTYLHPVFSTPKVTFGIRLDKTATLRALEAPTHTAEWESSKKITVEP